MHLNVKVHLKTHSGNVNIVPYLQNLMVNKKKNPVFV